MTERSYGGRKSEHQSDGGRKIKKVTVIPTKGPSGKPSLGLAKSKKNKNNSKDNNISKKLGGRNNEKTRFMDSLKSEDGVLVDAKRGPRF
mmetsp:Transcript_18302/g.28123  ORF Transcript_18302/g.28123 Transcript_18302/m.28123 type:complete len:90 (-) Transcript_18302:1656-1925(-)